MSVFLHLAQLQPGQVLLRSQDAPLFFERSYTDESGVIVYVFRDLEVGDDIHLEAWIADAVIAHCEWLVLERSLPVGHSGTVNSDDGSHQQAGLRKESTMSTQSLTSETTETTATPAEAVAAAETTKGKKTRTVDYTRTDKRPHSFRYKRHSTFVARSGSVSLSKDADGAFVIGPAPEGSTADAAKLEAGQLELVSVKKRPNGKTAIAFKHAELGDVVAYDARAARAALRAG